MTGLTCREIVGFLDDYVDGVQDARTRAVFESHLGLCEDCRRYLHSYKETIRLSRDACGCSKAPPPDVPKGLIEAILAARKAAGDRK